MLAIVESDQLHSTTRTHGAHLAGRGMGLRTVEARAPSESEFCEWLSPTRAWRA